MSAFPKFLKALEGLQGVQAAAVRSALRSENHIQIKSCDDMDDILGLVEEAIDCDEDVAVFALKDSKLSPTEQHELDDYFQAHKYVVSYEPSPEVMMEVAIRRHRGPAFHTIQLFVLAPSCVCARCQLGDQVVMSVDGVNIPLREPISPPTSPESPELLPSPRSNTPIAMAVSQDEHHWHHWTRSPQLPTPRNWSPFPDSSA